MARRTPAHLASALLLTASLTGVASPANAAWTDQVAYKRQGSTCADTGTGITIGAKVLMKELGKSGVTQMKTTYSLYDHDPTAAGAVPTSSVTRSGPTFANDKTSHVYDSGAGNKSSFTAAYGEWWIVAKLTWVRAGKASWTKTLPVAYCATQVG